MSQANELDELVKKMEGASLRRGGGSYIKGEGVFEVELISTMRKMGFNKAFTQRDKELFIAEFKIVSVTSTDENVVKGHVPGSTASWTCKDPSEGGAGDVQSFCIALLGKDPRTVKDTDTVARNQAALMALAAMGYAAAFEKIGIPENWFVGKRVSLETKIVMTKNNTPFTKHIWSPVATAAA